MKIALVVIVCCFTCSVFAQKTATWKGGAPGRSTDWTCAANWKEGRVPDAFSDVVIPDVSSCGNFQPVIRTEVEPIHSLCILPGATLNIQPGGTLEVSEPIETVANGCIRNRGELNAVVHPGAYAPEHPSLTLRR